MTKLRMYTGEVKQMLETAEANLKALNKNEITKIKAMRSPPVEVLLVIEAMCIINNIKPNKVCSGIYTIAQILQSNNFKIPKHFNIYAILIVKFRLNFIVVSFIISVIYLYIFHRARLFLCFCTFLILF